jgi:geranylgeranyl diphosphate synthase type I
MELPNVFNRYREHIITELASNINLSNSAIYDIIRYHMGWTNENGYPYDDGGKLVRPTFLLLSCEVVGGDWNIALPAAAAVELVHNFTLIHDDIEDGDHERRNRATAWCLWGRPHAINAGDALHSLARLALLRLGEKGVPPEKRQHTADIIDRTCLELCEGQYLDICYEDQFDIDIDAYLEMSNHKTASLFSAALQIGALIGTDDDTVVEQFRLLGRKIGLAYQMLDDVWGIWGKESASDIIKKKKTLPVIFALEHAETEDQQTLKEIYTKDNLEPEDAQLVVDILDKLNAEHYSRNMATGYYNEALAELEGIDLPQSERERMKEITDYLAQQAHQEA